MKPNRDEPSFQKLPINDLKGKKRPRTLQLIPWFGFSNYAYFDALNPEERKSEISLCQGQLKKPVSSITSYSWLFLRKIWPRTWQILILIRAGSELTTLAASIDRSLEKPVCSPCSQQHHLSPVLAISLHIEQPPREKLRGRRKPVQLLSKKGCRSSAVPAAYLPRDQAGQ